jgi:DeoR/GlpR family transcriptional regulator of sugar metabolism
MNNSSSHSSELLLPERQQEICRRLAVSDRVIAGELATEFNVSEDTIRRDLRELAASGQCVRVYGGALSVVARETPLAMRLDADVDRKRRLAAKMATVLQRGMLVFLDAGSTNIAAARELPDNLELTVATHSPLISAIICSKPNIRLFMIGGKVDDRVGAAIGAQSLRELQGLRPDMCFIGACAVESDTGITAFDAEDAEFKRAIVEASRLTLVAALNEKIGTAAPFFVMPLAGCNYLVVEHDLDDTRANTLITPDTALLRA